MVTKAVLVAAVLVVDSEVAWVLAVVVEEAAKSMSPTFVSFLPFSSVSLWWAVC